MTMDSTKALDDKAIDAAIREWMASDDMSADGFRLRMRAAIAAALAQGEAAQFAATNETAYKEALLKVEEVYYKYKGPDLAKKMYAVVSTALTYIGEPHTGPLYFDKMFPMDDEQAAAQAAAEGWDWIVPALQSRLKTLSSREIAKQVGCGHATICRVAKGKEPSVSNYFAIKRWLTGEAAQPADGAWVDWPGLKQPVDADTIIEFLADDGVIERRLARYIRWELPFKYRLPAPNAASQDGGRE